MKYSLDNPKQLIKQKIVELSARLDNDASDLNDDDIIPETGLLDSLSIMELLAWYEVTFERRIPQSDITLDNFGSINKMAAYLEQVNA